MTRLSVLCLLCIAFCGSAFPQHIHTDYDHKVDFAGFHTYTWQNSPNPAKGDWNQHIIDAIDRQLQAKGLTKVDANPDLWVVYSNSIRNEKDTVGIGYLPPPIIGEQGGPAGYATYVNKVGTLVVDLADTKTKQLVWRGSAADALSNNHSKNVKKVDKAIVKLFHDFPPQEKK